MMKRLLVYAVVLAALAGYLTWRAQPPRDVVIQLAADGSVQLDRSVIDPTELSSALRARLPEQRQPTVRVFVDERVPVPTLIPVMDAVRASGATDVRVATLE